MRQWFVTCHVRSGMACVSLAAALLGCGGRTHGKADLDTAAQRSTERDASPSGPSSGDRGAIGAAGAAAGQTGSAAPGGGTGQRTDAGAQLPAGDPALPCDEQPQVIDRVDLLFAIDNSGSMKEEQAALRAEFPRLVQVLTTGDLGDGSPSFPPVKELHLGVVSSDMGLVGIPDVDRCGGLGDDGIMNPREHWGPGRRPPEAANCKPSYPQRFLTYTAGFNNQQDTANDFACIAALGTEGCGFEQQLEAALKALWPSADDRVKFLGNVDGSSTRGQGDRANADFLRNDPATGRSLIAVIVVSDEEDCSSTTTAHFTPEHYLTPDDPLATQGPNLRCFYNPQNLYPIERYVNGLKALRPENPGLVLFAAIVGVPPDAVSSSVDFADVQAREAFYTALLAHPDMQERVEPPGSPDQGQLLIPSCNTASGRAYPPRRIVQTARGFGENGVVQSICTGDFAPAATAILSRIGERLRRPCLQTPD